MLSKSKLGARTLQSIASVDASTSGIGQASVAAIQLQRRHKSDKKLPVESKSFIENMYRGHIVTEQVFPYPQVLSEDQRETLEMLVPPTEKFMAEVNDPLLNDENGKVPEDVVQGLRELGAFGLQVPTNLDGVGLTNTQYARLTEIVGGNDLGVGIFIGAHQSIGFKGILIAGNDEQKKKYLPRLATGEDFAAFALTEPGSGSDAASIKTNAVLSDDGKHYILNGSKIWISNGGIAEIFTVFAKTPVKDDKTGETKMKITAFIVERKFGGVTHGPPEKKMGIKCSNTAEVYFENTPVPVENVIAGVGNGFKVAMQILNNGRFGMGAALSGTMRRVIAQAADHAKNRLQFENTINQYGTIQEKLARMSMTHYATESVAYLVAATMDRGYEDYQLEAAVSKIFASEAAWFVTDEGIQVMGGMGYMRDAGLEKVMRDLRIFRIFEGTNDILRLFLALTGMKYCGANLKELVRAVRDPLSNFGLIMSEAAKRGSGLIGLPNVESKSLVEQVHPDLAGPASKLAAKISLFSSAAESLAIKYKQDIIHEQFLLNRLAQATINMYVAAAVLSRCTASLNQNLPSAAHEKMMADLICHEKLTEIDALLSVLSSGSDIDRFALMKKISDNVCDNEKVVQSNPIGI